MAIQAKVAGQGSSLTLIGPRDQDIVEYLHSRRASCFSFFGEYLFLPHGNSREIDLQRGHKTIVIIPYDTNRQ